MPKPTPEQLEKINRFTQVPLTEDQVYVFRDLMIDDLETAYHTKIHLNLLEKFRQDTLAGVGLLMNHKWWSLPVGRSFDAELRIDFNENEESMYTLYGDYYIDLGRNTESGMTTDDIAKGIDAGTIFDTSIGFSAKLWECSICGNDIRDFMKCEHIPGKKYAVNRDGKDVVEKCVVIVGRDGEGELLENSLVYAGAAKRATIVKNKYSMGDVTGGQGENCSKLYLVENFKDIPLQATIYQYYSKNGSVFYTDTEERTNGSEHLRKRSEKQMQLDQLQEVLVKFNIKTDSLEAVESGLQSLVNELKDRDTRLSELSASVEEKDKLLAAKDETIAGLQQQLAAKDETISELEAANKELSEKASVADTYRQDLIKNTIEMGVRAYGNAFNAELYQKFLESLALDEIKQQYNAFEEVVQSKFAGARFSDPGAKEKRKTKNGEELYREDFDSEEEWGAYIAEKVEKYMKENPDVSISEATKLMVKKYSKRGE